MLKPRYQMFRCGVTCFPNTTISRGHAATRMNGNEDPETRSTAEAATAERALGMEVIVNNFANMS